MNRSSSFVILDESEDMGSSGSEDLVESLLVENASKGPCKTADALSTSPLLLTSQSDLESSSWAVLDASKTTSETTQTPKDTFLMNETENEEVVVNDAEAEVPALAATAELHPISAEGEMEASVERPSESDAQISLLSCLLERAFDFIQFLSNLFAHLDGTTKKAAVTVLVLSVLISVPYLHKRSNSSGLISELPLSDRLQSTQEDLEYCHKSLSKCESQVHSLSKSLAAANDKLHSSDSALTSCLRTLNWRQEKIEQYKTNTEQLQEKLKRTTEANERMQKTLIELQDKVIKYQSAVLDLKETIHYIERNSIYVPGLDTLKQLVCSITRLCPSGKEQ